MVDAYGMLAHYRKTHLWDREKLIFTPGDALPPVVKTEHGDIAMMVCFDVEFGELTRRVALDGAELIAAPVNWPLFPRPDGERPGEVITAMSTARTNKIAVACCDRAGVERGQQWTEGSAIVDPDGWVVASAGPGAAWPSPISTWLPPTTKHSPSGSTCSPTAASTSTDRAAPRRSPGSADAP